MAHLERGEIQLHCNLGTQDHPFASADGSSLLLATRPAIAIRDSIVVIPPDSAAIIRCGDRGNNPCDRIEL